MENKIINNTFLFNNICDDLIQEIIKYIKWFKATDKKFNITYFHRLNFINTEPRLDYVVFFFKKDENDLFSFESDKEDFSCKRHRKYKTNKKGLLEYNFKYRKYKELKF